MGGVEYRYDVAYELHDEALFSFTQQRFAVAIEGAKVSRAIAAAR